MKYTLNKQKNFNILLLLICFIITFFITYYYNSYAINILDDMEIFMFNNFYHGKYFTSFLLHFCCGFVPLFNKTIHSTTWLQTGGTVFKSVFLFILIYQISSFMFIFKKKNLFFPILILFNLLLYYQYAINDSHFLYESTFFYYCMTCFIPFFIFYKYLINIITSDKNKNRNLYVLFLSIFLLGISNDVLAVTTFYVLIFLFIFNKQFQNINRKNILFLMSTLLFTLSCSYLSPSFVERADGAYGLLRPFEQIISELFLYFNDFNLAYLNMFNKEFFIFSVIIVILSLIILYINKKHNKKNNSLLILVLFIYLSVLLFMYSLLFAGAFATQFVKHRDILFQSKIIFVLIINIQLSLLIFNKRLFYFIISLIIIFLCFKKYNIINNHLLYLKYFGLYNYILEQQVNITYKEFYQQRYIQERILLYYAYKGEKPILYGDEEIEFFYYYLILTDKYRTPFEDIELVNSLEESIEIYYKNGGPLITEEEIKKADFQKLLDKNFILNGSTQSKKTEQ